MTGSPRGTPAIDVVYTWVDGNWPGYLELCHQFRPRPVDLNPERFRDLFQLLRYSLRSLELYAPWVRRVYLFTCRPQVPDWLRLEHPKLQVVHHDEVFQCSDYLPTFNCNCIDSFLHLMPGSSDYILYFNDDFLLGRSVQPEDFLTPDGRVRLFGTVMGERLGRIYDKPHFFTSLALIEHTPLLIYRPYWSSMLQSRPRDVEATRRNRFRTSQDLRMDGLYRHYLLHDPQARVQVEPAHRLLKYHRFHKIVNRPLLQAWALKRLRRLAPKFYCLNDDQRAQPHPQVVQLVRQFLSDLYPEPSRFERT